MGPGPVRKQLKRTSPGPLPLFSAAGMHCDQNQSE